MVIILIIDGYVDEPTCLGVPPYISPYPRYIAGALWDHDSTQTIYYLTIDQIRNNPAHPYLSKANLIIVIAGMVVPGKYIGGYPASPRELLEYLASFPHPKKILCGPAARHGFGISGGKHSKPAEKLQDVFDLIITGDPEVVIHHLHSSKQSIAGIDVTERRADASVIKNWAQKGAKIVTQHPNYPEYIISEIETYRGCSRTITGGCSFCIEPLKGSPQHRPVHDVVTEIEALYAQGIRHFRLGNQPCLFSYQAKDTEKHEFPQPNPQALEKLYKGIRTVAPQLKTLHMDNANPGTIAHFPEESKQIMKTIINYHTPGDVAALGMETADPIVIKENNLKARPQDVERAIQLFNKLGNKTGINGFPELLPGLNFVFGLKGETKDTFQKNYEFLKAIKEQGLLLRRINLRQVIPFPKTPMYAIGNKLVRKHKHHFFQLKKRVQEDIERPLLKRLTPSGTIITDIFTEFHDGKTTFGRQIGSYPILIGIPGVLPIHKWTDVKIVEHGYRSLTGILYPLNINHAQRESIEALPGIGKKRATRIMVQRPFSSFETLGNALDDPHLLKAIQPYLTLE